MNNLFGTDGIRNKVGSFPFSHQSLPLIGKALAHWILKKYHNPIIILGHDTRQSCDWIISSLLSGLLLYPIRIHHVGILPTPAICNLLQRFNYDAGIIISASHNIFSDNGIKIIDRITGKLSEVDEREISQLISQDLPNSYTSFGSLGFVPTAKESYIHNILTYFSSDLLCGKKIALDCAHGATSFIAPPIFRALGAEIVVLHDSPNGTNINEKSGALHLDTLRNTVIENTCDIGFAFDGDGDRVIAVTSHGAIKNGDDILYILSKHPKYACQTQIVSTIMANHALEVSLQKEGKKLIRTPVGDKYVSDFMNSHNLLLGGEQSGHIVLHDYLPTGDGIFTALRLCETINKTNNWHLDTFTPYAQFLINVPIKEKKDLKLPHLAAIIKNHENQLDSGRLVVRYSGTESVLRIMVEDSQQEQAQAIATALAIYFQKELG